jgi:hypothetical protein
VDIAVGDILVISSFLKEVVSKETAPLALMMYGGGVSAVHLKLH